MGQGQAFFTANRVVDGTGALRPKFDQDSDTEQNSDRDVFWPLSRWVGNKNLRDAERPAVHLADAPGIDATARGGIARPPPQAST